MSTPEIVRLTTPVTEQDHVSGSEAAPVTLVEYGNFECIHCGRAFPVIKQLQALLVMICALCFVTFRLSKRIRILCEPQKQLNQQYVLVER